MTNPRQQNGRLALENPPLERATLGALIKDTQTFWNVRPRIKPDLFTVPFHIALVAVLHKIADAGRDFSIPSILARMPEQSGDFSPEGYLATLVYEEAHVDAVEDNLTDLESSWARRKMLLLGEELMRQARDDSGLGIVDRLEAAKAKVDGIADPLGSGVKHIAEVSARLLARVEEASTNERPVGLDLGLKCLQDLTGPLMPGRVYSLFGPPGSGKSALAYQVACYIAAHKKVLFCSPEMEDEELAERDLSARTGITTDRIERASINLAELEKLFDAAHDHRTLGIYIDDTTAPRVSQIRSKAMRMKRLEGLDLLVVDHLLEVQPDNDKMGEFERYRAIMQTFKRIAKDLSIPVLILGQLLKGFGDVEWKKIRRPRVSDIYGGSGPEQVSDVVVFVHRPEYLLRRSEPDEQALDRAEWLVAMQRAIGRAELIVGKRRGGAPAGVRQCWFDGANGARFSDSPPRAPTEDLLNEAGISFS